MNAIINEDDARIKYIESVTKIFIEAPVAHGQRFDDGRRWCGTCEAPKLICTPTEDTPLADKICNDCNSIWPEWQNVLMSDDWYDENVEDLDLLDDDYHE